MTNFIIFSICFVLSFNLLAFAEDNHISDKRENILQIMPEEDQYIVVEDGALNAEKHNDIYNEVQEYDSENNIGKKSYSVPKPEIKKVGSIVFLDNESEISDKNRKFINAQLIPALRGLEGKIILCSFSRKNNLEDQYDSKIVSIKRLVAIRRILVDNQIDIRNIQIMNNTDDNKKNEVVVGVLKGN